MFWEIYEDITRSVVTAFVKELPVWHRQAIWFQTEAGIDWRFDDEETRETNQFNDDVIVEFLLDTYIWSEAGRWTNKRILDYLDRACASD